MDFERLRARYRPVRIVALFVGESPPAGDTFFYAANSNLYRHTERAFRGALDHRIGSDFLVSFAALGCYLDDLCLKPVNQLDNLERREARIAGEARLAARIRSYAPRVVIGIGYTRERHFQRAHQPTHGRTYHCTCCPFRTGLINAGSTSTDWRRSYGASMTPASFRNDQERNTTHAWWRWASPPWSTV